MTIRRSPQIKTMREYAVRRGWQIAAEIRRLYRKECRTKSEIARRLGIGRTSVRRLLGAA